MIEFKQDGLYSKRFDDVYFNTQNPLLECFHTYSSVVDALEGSNITIAEAGFGAGLNFFSTVSSLNGKNLHYIAIEKYPFNKDELRQIYQRFECFSRYFDEFIKQYEVLQNALIRINLGKDIILDIYFGDILEGLKELNFKADAWYLDGFTPAKNPQMWSEELFGAIKYFCKNGAIIRTFSSASIVRLRLLDAGFSVKKLKGFGKKREMLEAICVKEYQKPQNWYSLPAIDKFTNVLVIGGGVAGLVSATKFKKAGFNVVVAEKMNEVATNGSSNLAGILMPLITLPTTVLGLMHMSAFLMARNFYKDSEFSDFCGVDDYGVSELQLKRFEEWGQNGIFELTKNSSLYPSAFIKSAAQLMPKSLCSDLAKSLYVKFGYEFAGLKKSGDGYLVEFKNQKRVSADLVIFAMGDKSNYLFNEVFYDEYMQLSSVRGQVTHIKNGIDLERPFSAKGYACKSVNGVQVIGATYDRNDFTSCARSKDNEKNIADISEFLIGKNVDIIGSNVGFRGYSGDRSPLIGAVHDALKFKEIYKSLLWTKNRENHAGAVHHQNILISSAHGSRGLCTAVFGAEILLDMVLGRQICTTKSILDSLNPARFLVRKLKKGLVK
ncbi:5-methylaminomethyl-2-thiouridine methyltransferase [Campylobacter hyointestinalis]|uniref:bifunctional tRNA (5-methylaminomethyl-2-thiouridine)(34)-methyltransferase MnmD/FAD-dependent 5-carboxymethylaminomethyl-2-thiouridine(34) oxidoreductase MnmC n=1 Tax=Campylobacter hyointestinalis TaxID=198 RepID=UPI000723DE9C|nr:bifunctional tRNA (5-methylaminomethyl-2-thiouridine)(34)-methyltransferase MnmD/FAD-dependent 5-carboxymethylaminomethyl-2-thiouridine(34) oxidoreductase MnmC [Campylobacter hyointestinalis]CUU77055.1 5-methylaminomethyl-2-thiouridine methyltransferase [Campylobacter hyointestinalis]